MKAKPYALTAALCIVLIEATASGSLMRAEQLVITQCFTPIYAPGLLNLIVWLALCIMGCLTVAIGVERALKYRACRRDSELRAPAVSVALSHSGLEDAIEASQEPAKSHIIPVLNATLRGVRDSRANHTAVRAKLACDRAVAAQAAQLRKGLWTLDTIGQAALLVASAEAAIELSTGFGLARYTWSPDPIGEAGTEAFRVLAFGLAISLAALVSHRRLSFNAQALISEAEQASSELISALLERASTSRSRQGTYWR